MDSEIPQEVLDAHYRDGYEDGYHESYEEVSAENYRLGREDTLAEFGLDPEPPAGLVENFPRRVSWFNRQAEKARLKEIYHG